MPRRLGSYTVVILATDSRLGADCGVDAHASRKPHRNKLVPEKLKVDCYNNGINK